MKRIDKVWQLMSTYNFVPLNNISIGMTCGICKKLMIEPYATVCGCMFCKKCIKDYLGDTRKKCPGNKDMCNEDFLELEINVNKDNRTASSISKIVVKCPNEKCTVEKELDSIEKHIRDCNMRPMPCPYQVIGCGDNEITGDSIDLHLQKEGLNHAQLLLEAINNLRNDIDGLKESRNVNEDSNKWQEERNITNLEFENIRQVMRGLTRECEGNKRNADNQLREINKINDERGRDNADRHGIRAEINGLTNEIKALRIEDYDAQIKSGEMETGLKKELDILKRDLETVKKNVGGQKEFEELKKQLTRQNQEMEVMKLKLLKYSDELEKANRNKIGTIPLGLYDCVWSIEDLGKKKGEHFSEMFSMNNYKLCLRAWLGPGNLWLFVCIRRGERDDKAEWPMKHSLTLSILNQETLRPFLSERYSVDTYDGDVAVFSRPSNDTDGRIGNMQVSLADIRSVPGVLSRTGSLLVSCALTPPTK